MRVHSLLTLAAVALFSISISLGTAASSRAEESPLTTGAHAGSCEISGFVETEPRKLSIRFPEQESKRLPPSLKLVTSSRRSGSLEDRLIFASPTDSALRSYGRNGEMTSLSVLEEGAGSPCKWSEGYSSDIGWGDDDEIVALSESGDSFCIRLRDEAGEDRVERISLTPRYLPASLIGVMPKHKNSSLLMALSHAPGRSGRLQVFLIDLNSKVSTLAVEGEAPGPLTVARVKEKEFAYLRTGVNAGKVDTVGITHPLVPIGEQPPWADVPKGCDPRIRAVGDFDGNGIEDLLLEGRSLCGWWIVMSSGRTGIEIPIGSPFSPGSQLHAVDWDGDGVDEVAEYNSESGDLRIGFFLRGSGLSGVRIDGGAESVATGASGRFSMRVPAGATYLIVPSSPDLSFSPQSKDVDCPAMVETGARAHAGFIGAPLKRDSRFGLTDAVAQPSVCIGYHEIGANKWAGERDFECEPGFAVYSADDSDYSRKPVRLTGVACCPMPADDILTNRHSLVERSCPDGSVITGYVLDFTVSRDLIFRCTEINKDKYALAPGRPGMYWGHGISSPLSEKQMPLSAIPAAIRYSVGRRSENEWDVDGCVGEPPGSLLTSIGTGSCRTMVFRRLLARPGSVDDAAGKAPPDPEPVKMFPDCAEVENPFDPRTECIPASDAR